MNAAACFRLLLLFVVLAGCNLTTAPPTPTLAPTLPPTLEPLFTPAPVDMAPVNPDCLLTPPGWVAYTIEEGDNLSTLAEQTASTVAELVTNNCLENPDQLFVGLVIFLPQMPVAAP